MTNADKEASSRLQVVDEFECNLALSDKFAHDGFKGVTLAYAVGVLERGVIMQYEYNLTPVVSWGPNDPQETRAYREILRSRGEKIPKIEKNALRDELVILPGAAMSPADVVEALKKFISHVERDGMDIGKYNNDFIIERIEGEPRLVTEFGEPIPR
jgi:hypothetical protein